MKKGFTLIELLITLSIFVFMTVLLVVKYGNFNQGVLLTNLVYDVALVVRTAQTYGLSVSNAGAQSGTAQFGYSYGVDFSTVAVTAGDPKEKPGNTKVIMFADSYPVGAPDNMYNYSGAYPNNSDAQQNTYNITRGAKITLLCAGSVSICQNAIVSNATQIDVTFKRPDPNATICYTDLSNSTSCLSAGAPISYAKIQMTGTDQSTRTLEIYRNGQISIVTQ